MQLKGTLYQFYKRQSILFRLIIINVAVFLAISIFDVIYSFGGISRQVYEWIHIQVGLPASFGLFIHKPWTIITYMFVHSTANIFHILFNMLMLYWFGRIFLDFRKEKKIIWIYIFGGISGGLLYMLAYSVIPVLAASRPEFGLIGASASVIAILVATAVLVPDYSVGVLLIGQVKLKYIAIILIIIDVISLKGNNTGGHFAHLGGAIYGLLYTLHIKGLLGFTQRIEFFLSRWKSIIRRDGVKTLRYKTVREKKEIKKEAHKAARDQEIIDRILDKISKSGYESLSEEEKDRLFNASKK